MNLIVRHTYSRVVVSNFSFPLYHEAMVRNIILALLAFALIAMLVFWVISGGPRKVITATTDSLINAVPTSEAGFRLPWQPVQLFPTLDITGALDLTEPTESLTPQERLVSLEAEYERLNREVSDQRSFGAPSRYAGKITIVQDTASIRADTNLDEHVQIAARASNEESIDITGWVLESALSGVRVVVPPAASPFYANSTNILERVLLEPGALALVSSSISPIGTSFQENTCTGYLGQFQQFSPPLFEACPAASSVLPLTAENIARYGESCFDTISYLPTCRFPTTLPAEVSSACRAYLTEFLSYNGCVNRERTRSSFEKGYWRLYLGSNTELWRNSHDAIRLLDHEGKTVSVLVY